MGRAVAAATVARHWLVDGVTEGLQIYGGRNLSAVRQAVSARRYRVLFLWRTYWGDQDSYTADTYHTDTAGGAP
jgi:hypothetical protein